MATPVTATTTKAAGNSVAANTNPLDFLATVATAADRCDYVDSPLSYLVVTAALVKSGHENFIWTVPAGCVPSEGHGIVEGTPAQPPTAAGVSDLPDPALANTGAENKPPRRSTRARSVAPRLRWSQHHPLQRLAPRSHGHPRRPPPPTARRRLEGRSKARSEARPKKTGRSKSVKKAKQPATSQAQDAVAAEAQVPIDAVAEENTLTGNAVSSEVAVAVPAKKGKGKGRTEKQSRPATTPSRTSPRLTKQPQEAPAVTSTTSSTSD
ncbi:hypothetical protein BKA62DRAFT_811061 [Auriculariales sp. MPI-PUGE-AT-0066]|nr:hypothetical protein BKA62DRAFT_811061 [Auriculariales sp. MPI-PUGE-AT-0066]